MSTHGNTNVSKGCDYSLTVGGVTVSGSMETGNLKCNAPQAITAKNSVGDTITKDYADISEEEVTFKFVTLTANFAPWSKGTMVTCALGTSGKGTTYFTGSNWIVENYSIDESNAELRRGEYTLSRNSNITA